MSDKRIGHQNGTSLQPGSGNKVGPAWQGPGSFSQGSCSPSLNPSSNGCADKTPKEKTPPTGKLVFSCFLAFCAVAIFWPDICKYVTRKVGDIKRSTVAAQTARNASSEMSTLVKDSAAAQILVQARKMTIRDFDEGSTSKLVAGQSMVCSELAPAGFVAQSKATVYSKVDPSFNEYNESWRQAGVQMVYYFTQAKADLSVPEQEALKKLGGVSPFRAVSIGATGLSYDVLNETGNPGCKSRSTATRKAAVDAQGQGFVLGLAGEGAQKFTPATEQAVNQSTPTATNKSPDGKTTGANSLPSGKVYKPLERVKPRSPAPGSSS